MLSIYNINFALFERCFNQNHNFTKISPGKYPLIPTTYEDIYNLLQEDDGIICHQWEVTPPPKLYKGEDITSKWRLGNSICRDFLPKTQTSSTCRIYSVKYDTEDMTFEIEKGKQGCRVHVWGNKTIYSYMKLGTNVYFYPVDISTKSSPGVYSLDDFVGLMGHKDLKIHLLKSTTAGGHQSLLRALYASKSKLWENIEQIQFILHLPKLSPETWNEIESHYRDLVHLRTFGYSLARVRKDPRFLYTEKIEKAEELDKEIDFSTIYELVWIRSGKYLLDQEF